MVEPSAARKFFGIRLSDAEREQIERAALNARLAPATFVREAALALAGVDAAEERLARARAAQAEAQFIAETVELDPEPHRVTVYTGAEYVDRLRGEFPAGGVMVDPARYEIP
jgi:hypothetical protein